MTRLNRGPLVLLRGFPDAVHAATDVTGFALAGHGREMAEQSGLAFEIRWDAVPLLDGARQYAEAGSVPGGGRRNRDYFGEWVVSKLAPSDETLLYDPQTSGGLLFAVDPGSADDVERTFRNAGEPLWAIGRAVARRPGTIEIV